MVGCWYAPYLPAMIVSPSRICRDHNFRGFASVGLLGSNEAWIRLSARSVPTTMSLSAPISVKGYFTVTLSSAPPLLSTPFRCLSQCSASIRLQQAIPTKPSILPRRYRHCLHPLLLLLNSLPVPPRRPGRHCLVPAAQHVAHVLLQLSNLRRLLASAWI
jgi:hypothetical protein